MKTLSILFLLAVAMTSCTNNATITGIDNTDTVELNDEFGRDAFPEIKPDTGYRDTLQDLDIR